MFRRWLQGWADASLRLENEQLSDKLTEARSQLRIQKLELDQLAAVVARNIKRTEAETAAAARNIAGQ